MYKLVSKGSLVSSSDCHSLAYPVCLFLLFVLHPEMKIKETKSCSLPSVYYGQCKSKSEKTGEAWELGYSVCSG